MHPLHKRLLLLVALGLLAVPVTAVGVAYACTALATTSVNRSAATVGDTVTVSGKGFAPHDASDLRTSPAEVHMDSATGPVLAKVSPSSSNTGGTFSVDVTVPDVAPGEHVLVVTQNGIDGRPAYGTPARTVLTVQPKPAPPPAAVAQPVVAAAPAPAPVIAPFVAPVVNTPAAPSTSRSSSALAKAKAKARAKARARSRALASCRSKYNAKRAKTATGRKRMATRRAACVRAASRR